MYLINKHCYLDKMYTFYDHTSSHYDSDSSSSLDNHDFDSNSDKINYKQHRSFLENSPLIPTPGVGIAGKGSLNNEERYNLMDEVVLKERQSFQIFNKLLMHCIISTPFVGKLGIHPIHATEARAMNMHETSVTE